MRLATRYLAFVLLSATFLAAAEPQLCWSARKLGKTAEAEACFAALTRSASAAERAEGLWGQGAFDAANVSFREALTRDPSSLDVRVRWGRLFLERANKEEAQQLFREALKVNEKHAGALLGMALLSAEGFSSKAEELAAKAAEADPKLLEAQELLARLALERNRLDEARQIGRKAVAMKPGEALDAMAVLAAADWLEDKASSEWETKSLAINPKYGEFYGIAARIFILHRRYRESIALYEKALALEPANSRSRSEMGINLMRLGRDKEARQNLETSYNAGFRDAATVNTLRLLDSYSRFDLIRKGNTILRLNKKESEPLRIYVQAELDRAMAAFDKKYKMKLTEPFQLELYPDHEDFAVRTMGLPGLGALGVAFGDTVAMDSPTARPPGEFHWASTLWHELSHVYVLKLTDHKVPRWFTEGISVHEETQVSKEWGDRLDPPVLKAVREKTLLPVAELDKGFQQPDTPTQVIVSYFQAGRVVDYIVETWGWEKVLAMIAGFKQMKPTAEVIQAQLGIPAEEFDKKFLTWLDAHVGKMANDFGEWEKKMPGVVKAAKAKDWDAVLAEGTAVRDLYPEYVGKSSAYELLADAYMMKKQPEKAIDELWRYTRKGGRDPVILKRLAGLLSEKQRDKEAADVLARLNFIYPLDTDLHEKLGTLYAKLGNKRGAITEFNALVAMKPVDLAGAHLRLAKAYRANNQKEQATDHVFLALEVAPGFKEAQKLLLELTSTNQ
ncbi:MAG: tetratricopeptide repeat protein [Bryobacterales bacterium]|nr:tetratricopeptide repeat protein [Bryobacterales bacterium]